MTTGSLVISFLLNDEVRPVWGAGDDVALLAAYEKVWQRKAILRQVYETWYVRLAAWLRPGLVVEIGAGTGNFRRWLGSQGWQTFSIDVLPGASVDLRADALHLPLGSASVPNLVLIDALHHFAQPLAFLDEAARVLAPGGRLVFLEPFVSAWGGLVYRWLHHETVDTARARVLVEPGPRGTPWKPAAGVKAAWEGNAAIPRAVLDRLLAGGPPVRLVHVGYSDFLAYPLSGGFSYRALLPEPLLRVLHRLERSPLTANRLLALRVLAVLER